ncbi:MAG: hypothetical protein MASP_01783 [Candidatus Methanolliviera sp. GoM_asphalt]|nr:MAG: hypothetical protein MASP_01783 [Candidatus Methanolliviera sp. GoM_asphalt]
MSEMSVKWVFEIDRENVMVASVRYASMNAPLRL